jgi:AAA family ATP:ADP antiporter
VAVVRTERRIPLLGRAVDVREGEGGAVLLAFGWFFALLLGYYLLRPLRDEMGIRGDVTKLHWQFTATFAVMLAAVPLYSSLVARVPRRVAVPWVYRFFLLNLVVFWALLRADVAPVWVARTFYVWVSVYNLFVVSVFWSLLADLFTSGQGKRLFGFVAAGGSAGALLGSSVVALLVEPLGIANLLVLSAACLEVSARCAAALARRAAGAGGSLAPERSPGEARRADAPGGAPLGGSAWAGFAAVARSPYLLAIALQLVLYSLGSTFLYFNLARTIAGAIPDSAARAALFAKVDLTVSLAALATQSLATGRIVAALGLGGALALVPVLSTLGFAAAAARPGVWTLGTFQVLRRAAHFAVDRPSREVLFTVVPREDKYKAKAFIDTFLYRGADAAAGWLHAGLAALGLGLPGLSLAAIPFAIVSVAVAAWLGRRERRLEAALRNRTADDLRL